MFPFESEINRIMFPGPLFGTLTEFRQCRSPSSPWLREHGMLINELISISHLEHHHLDTTECLPEIS